MSLDGMNENTIEYSIKLKFIMDAHNLKAVYLPEKANDIEIMTTEVGRPGLQLTGFYDFFDDRRIQILGLTEFGYFETLKKEDFEMFDKDNKSKKTKKVIFSSADKNNPAKFYINSAPAHHKFSTKKITKKMEFFL